MPNRTVCNPLVRAILPALCLLPAFAGASAAGADASALGGTWCLQDATEGETVKRYSVTGLEVSALTVLSEADPRLMGGQSTMQLTVDAPNVFSRRDTDERFHVRGDVLTVESATPQSYRRCNFREAFQRAQSFLFSPRAEAATRLALQREAAAKEQWRLEDAATVERRNVSQEMYYSALLQQFSQARFSSASSTSNSRNRALAYSAPAPSAAGGE